MTYTRILTITLNPALDISTRADRVLPEIKLRCAPPRSQPGGGGVNVSRAIAHLGGESTALVAVGGAEGHALLEQLRAEGLQPLAIETPHPTRISLAVTEGESGAQFRFILPGPTWSAGTTDLIRSKVVEALREGDIVVASGSLPPGVPPGFFTDMARGLVAQRMIFDSSGDALRLAAKGHEGARGLDTLRMDDEEAAEIAGSPMSHPDLIAPFARALRDRGAARAVLIAAGAHGTVMADEDGCWLTVPPKVRVVSKVGAGDSFVAGYALALARGASRTEACIAGTGAAAAAVETPDSDLCDGPTAALRAKQTVLHRL